jgi:SAM-dependent methyltransferase
MLPVPDRSDAFELLEAPALLEGELAANLGDIRRLNAWFGGRALTVRRVREMIGTRVCATILDVACGSADIPVAIERWARRSEREVRITASDVSSEVLREAARLLTETEIELVAADARSLPWADRSFDVVMCSLALHHFDPDDAKRVLAEMWRVAGSGIVVVDLYRSYAAYVGTWAATHVVARNRIARHDGPLSVLRAYTPSELRALAVSAGVDAPVVKLSPFFRQSLVAVRDGRLDG